jgi:predicted O-methyltransferase YrrM
MSRLKLIPILSSVLFGLASVTFVGYAWSLIRSKPQIVEVLTLGLGCLVIAVLLYIFQNLRTHMDLLEKQVQAVHSSIALARFAPSSPTFFLRHAAAPDFIELVFEVIRRKTIKRVLELGCGTSTLYISKVLPPARDGGFILCLEDNLPWVELIQSELQKQASDDSPKFSILHAPLVDIDQDMKFYDLPVSDIERWLPFDLIVVDGPSNSRYRLATKRALEGSLSPEGVVIFDDGDNPDIKKAVQDWLSDDATRPIKYYPTVKGTWILWTGRQVNGLPLP